MLDRGGSDDTDEATLLKIDIAGTDLEVEDSSPKVVEDVWFAKAEDCDVGLEELNGVPSSVVDDISEYVVADVASVVPKDLLVLVIKDVDETSSDNVSEAEVETTPSVPDAVIELTFSDDDFVSVALEVPENTEDKLS